MTRLPNDAPTATLVAPDGAVPPDHAAPPGGGSPAFPGASLRPPGPSVRPALIVLGIAALVLLMGVIGAALTSSGSALPTKVRSLATAPGAGMTAMEGAGLLAPIATGGEPPADILDAVALPKGTTVTTGSATNNGIGLYDRSLSFSLPVSEQAVITFFRVELKALKWQIVSQGPPPGGTPGYRIVGQHPSSDGYEWEIGVTVAPTTFGSASSATTDTTSYTVRLFAVTGD